MCKFIGYYLPLCIYVLYNMLLSDVWMLGDSILYWAGERAKRLARPHLNLKHLHLTIRWYGKRGMSWDSLRQDIQWITLHRPPAMILIHLGGNNVLNTSYQKIRRVIQRDFKYLSETFPSTILVWSDILPRLKWKFSRENSDLDAINHKRHRFNLIAHQILQRLDMGRILKHDISLDTPGLFGSDGCHLSEVGTALFPNTIQGGIEAFLTSDIKVFGI